jgi:hypothetical protein
MRGEIGRQKGRNGERKEGREGRNGGNAPFRRKEIREN